MIFRILGCCALAALCGCSADRQGTNQVKAIIGAILIDGNGGPPISDSVVVVSGSRIRAAGLRAHVSIPADSDKIDGSGKFLVPGLIDLDYKGGDGNLGFGVTTVRRTVGAEADTAGKVAELAAKRAEFVFVRPAASGVIFEEARKYNLPVTASVTTLADAQQLVKYGAAGFIGMIGDTEDLDQPFLAKIRALKLVFTPALVSQADRAVMMRNTKRMAAAGVAIGVGSGGAGGDTHRELELLVEAGLTPLEVATAATRNGALALGKPSETGTIEAGKRADLLMLKANPLEDVRNFASIDQVMIGGEWLDRAAIGRK